MQRSALFVASTMVPGIVVGMVAPFCLMHGFSVFLLRQFFLSIPKEL
nr:hypothetical protein [uncultured Rhodoferax sp.]